MTENIVKLIYILEDDNVLIELTEHILQRQGFSLKSFTNYTDLWEHMRQEKPDLIILDHLLSGSRTGLECCHLIKSTAEYALIPIILTSGQDIVFSDQKGKNPDDYLKKPFEPNDLLKNIHRLLK